MNSESNISRRRDAKHVIRDIRVAQRLLAASPLTAENFKKMNGPDGALEELLGKTIIFDLLDEDGVIALRKELISAMETNLDAAFNQLKSSTHGIVVPATEEMSFDPSAVKIPDATKISDLKNVDDVISKLELEKTVAFCDALTAFYNDNVIPAAVSIVTDDDKNGDGEDTEHTGDEPDDDGDDPEKGDGNGGEEEGEDGEVVPGTEKALKQLVKELVPADRITYLHDDVAAGEWTAENWKPAVESFCESVKNLKTALAKTKELFDMSTFTGEDYINCCDSLLDSMDKLGKITRSVTDRVNVCSTFINTVNKSLA